MVLDKLGSSLRGAMDKVTKAVFVDDKLVNELAKEIQRALLYADVNVKLVFKLTETIKKRVLKEDLPAGLTKKEYLINVVYEELVAFLGKEEISFDTSKKPLKLMLVGLFGNGKTTTTGKLAKYFKKRGKKIAVVQTDTWRPAAYDQLKQLAESIDVPFFGDKSAKTPDEIVDKFRDDVQKYDIVIYDTAGRDALNDELIEELNVLNKSIDPDNTLLVLNADIGQSAEKQATTFAESCNVTGVIITKMDGTAKGGGALSACSITKAHVAFIGVGEKIDDLEVFNPERFVGRLLGMGDIESLLEKAKDAMDMESAEDMTERMMSGEFNLIDLYSQMEAMGKMGSLSKIMDMIPGMGKLNIPKDAMNVQEDKMKQWKFIMNSCTKKELESPDMIDRSRIERIVKGSGTSEEDVRELLKNYKQSKKMIKAMSGQGMGSGKMKKMMKKMGKGGMNLSPEMMNQMKGMGGFK